MSEPIRLDLTKDLTIERIKEALPHLKGKSCKYTAPCIIGTMLPEELRAQIDDGEVDEENTGPHVKRLAELGVLEFATYTQLDDAQALQLAFDDGACGKFLDVAERYVSDLRLLLK